MSHRNPHQLLTKENPQVLYRQGRYSVTHNNLSKAISPHLIYSPIYLSRIYSLQLCCETSNRQENVIVMKSADQTVKGEKTFNVQPEDLRLDHASIPAQWLSVWAVAHCHLPPHGSECVFETAECRKTYSMQSSLSHCLSAKSIFTQSREALSSLAKATL